MSQVWTRLWKRVTTFFIASATAMGLLVFQPTSAMASSPSITLSVNSLQYGYNGPVTINVTGIGTHFVQGLSVVYVINNNNGADTRAATNFQVIDSTHMSFSLGSGLGNPTTDTQYTIDVQTPDPQSGTVEEEQATLTVTALPSITNVTIAGQSDNTWLGTGFQPVTVVLTAKNAKLSTQTQVLIQPVGGAATTANVSGVQINTAAQTATFTLSDNPPLSAGTYNFVLRTNGQDVTTPFVIRQPNAALASQTLPIGTQNTVIFDATNANFSAGNVKVTLTAGQASHTYNATIINKNEISFVIPASDFPQPVSNVGLTVQDNSESFTLANYFNFVDTTTTPIASASPTSVSEGYAGPKTINLVTTGLSLDNTTNVQLFDGNNTDRSTFIAGKTPQGSTEAVTLNSGLPAGNYTFVITDKNQKTARANFVVLGVAPVITVGTIPPATIGQSYTSGNAITAQGTAPVTWSIVSGALPAGLNLNTNTGVISGTPTGPANSYPVTIMAQNGYGSATQAITIQVGAKPTITLPTTIPTGTQGSSYTLNLSAQGDGTITWSISSGSLPAGLTLNPNTGVISGTLSATATTSTFTVTASSTFGSDSKSVTITVSSNNPGNPGTPSSGNPAPSATVTPSSLEEGYADGTTLTIATTGLTLDVSATVTLQKDGQTVSGYVKNTAVQGNNEIVTLASGLGVGTYTVVIKDKNNQSASATFTITGRAPKISIGTLPEGTQGQAYDTDALSATGTSPMTWSIVSGSLPSGLTLDEKTGHISGTLAADAQTSTFTVKVTNAYGSDTKEVTITVNAARPLKISDVTPPLATVGASYYLKLSVEGGLRVTWSLAGGSLPSGLHLNSNGTITGKVKPGAQTSTFTVQATDDQGNSATKDITIEVTKQKIVNNVFATATVNSPYLALLKSSLSGDVIWDVVSGALPNGLELEGNVIKGTPTKAGKFTFTLQASTDKAVLVNTYTIEVFKAVNKGHLKDVTVKTPYVNSIVDMTSKHYIGVYKDGTFHPNGTVSRGQFVSYLYQLLLDNKKIKPYYSKTSLFKDVPKNDPLSLQINTLAHYGYLPKGTLFHEAWGAEQWWIAQVMLNVLGVKYDARNAYDALNQARFNGLWSLDATYRVNRAQVAEVLEHIYTHVKKK